MYRNKYPSVKIQDLIGKTFTSITREDYKVLGRAGSDGIVLKNSDAIYGLFHNQDCCEGVDIEEIIGELSDLEGTPILLAEERTSDASKSGDDNFATWTFYEFRTIKGSVTIRFYGSSNGYYSETADINELTEV